MPRPVAAGLTLAFGGLAIAVVAGYWDGAWHADNGRDVSQFTAPHALFVTVFVFLFAAAGVVLGGLRVRARSGLLLLALAAGSLAGFPLDQLWHRWFGSDVTLWGPSHLLMLAGPAFTPIALWLMVAEFGVRHGDSRTGRRLHATMAVATLIGLSTFQGEMDYGLLQSQLLYQPVIVTIAASIALTCARISLGPGGALTAAFGFLAVRIGVVALIGPVMGYSVPHFPLYLGSALAVELAAAVLGTASRKRFAIGAGIAVATIGFAVEWGWAEAAGRYSWNALFPEALLAVGPAAIGAALVGAALGAIVSGERPRIGAPLLSAAAVALAVSIAVPFHRTDGDVRAVVTLERFGNRAVVEAQLDPPGAARDAKWFHVMSWQGGAVALADMTAVRPGIYRSLGPVPIGGTAKTFIRLHRGSEMLGFPVSMPADPAIGARAVPAVDRSGAFVQDSELFLRERRNGPVWAGLLVGTPVALLAAAQLALIVMVASRLGRRYAYGTRSRPSTQPVQPLEHTIRDQSPHRSAT